MAMQAGPVNAFEKQQIRNQIRCQVEEYLRRGGEIRVLDAPGKKRNGAQRASVWHGQEDINELID